MNKTENKKKEDILKKAKEIVSIEGWSSEIFSKLQKQNIEKNDLFYFLKNWRDEDKIVKILKKKILMPNEVINEKKLELVFDQVIKKNPIRTVSYTHLTLPTIYSV